MGKFGWKTGTDRLTPHRVTTDFQFVKNKRKKRQGTIKEACLEKGRRTPSVRSFRPLPESCLLCLKFSSVVKVLRQVVSNLQVKTETDKKVIC